MERQRSRRFDRRDLGVTNSTSPISIAEPRGVPGAGKIVIARLRDLALLAGAGAAHRYRRDRQSGVPDRRQHQHHPHLVGGARPSRARRVADHHHRQVRPVARVDLRLRARDRGDDGGARRQIRLRLRAAQQRRHSGGAPCWRPDRVHQRLYGGAPAPERLHRHARHADHPSRHAGRGDKRADAVRSS